MKILYILSFISLLNATPSPITTEEIEHLKSTDVISATANITDQSQDFDKEVYNWNVTTEPDLQGMLNLFPSVEDHLIHGVNPKKKLQRLIKILYPSVYRGNHSTEDFLGEVIPFIQKCINEFNMYKNGESITFSTNNINVPYQYHAIFNSTSDWMAKNMGEIPNFIALFSLLYLLEEFKNKFEDLITNYSVPIHDVFGDVASILEDKEILHKAFNNDEDIIKLFDGPNIKKDSWQYMRWKISTFATIALNNGPNEIDKLIAEAYFSDGHGTKYYYELVIEKLAEKFLKHLNINHINIGGFSPEFLEYATKYTNFPVLIKALNK